MPTSELYRHYYAGQAGKKKSVIFTRDSAKVLQRQNGTITFKARSNGTLCTQTLLDMTGRLGLGVGYQKKIRPHFQLIQGLCPVPCAPVSLLSFSSLEVFLYLTSKKDCYIGAETGVKAD